VTAHNDGPKWSFLDVENGRRRGLDETRWLLEREEGFFLKA
jgi:hypothetical protein